MPERAKEGPISAGRGTVATPTLAPGLGSPAPSEAERERTLGAGYGYASLQVAAGAAEPPPSFRLTAGGLLALQRAAGNRAVAAAMERIVQRVPVAVTGGETLYNQEAPGGKAGAAAYGGSSTFQMTRDADTAVNVEVKIKFLRQARNTMPPRRPSDPRVGALTGEPTELPAGDRAWATTTATSAMGHWNGRLTLAGVDKPRPDAADVNKRLPVKFKATPLFGKDDTADTTVIVHPPGVVGGSTGNPIDAGNYYMKKNDSVYPDTDDKIYAHEYGHLLGINDEYSQSNEQINLLLHRASPAEAVSSMAALDQATVELMTLATLSRPLYAQLMAVMPPISSALRRKRTSIKQKMTVAAREAVRSAEVRDLLTTRLTAMSTARVQPRVPQAVAAQTTTNFSQSGVASAGVDRVFSAGAISTKIGDTYWNAMTKPQGENVAVPGLGDVKINVQSSVFGAAAGPRNPLGTSARGEAAGQIGARPRPGLPYVPAPGTLAAQLLAEAGTWDGAGGSIEAKITAASFQAKMLATLTAATAAAVAPPPPGAAAPGPSIGSGRALHGKAWVLINNAANTACRELASDLIGSTMDPILETSVGQLRVAISTEVTRIRTMSPAELAANPSPDPNMAAIVGNMKGRLDSAKTALRGTGMNPLGVEGATTPAQDVTYSYQGLMGSGATTALRTDQFKTLVDNFNTQLKLATEQNFKAEVS